MTHKKRGRVDTSDGICVQCKEGSMDEYTSYCCGEVEWCGYCLHDIQDEAELRGAEKMREAAIVMGCGFCRNKIQIETDSRGNVSHVLSYGPARCDSRFIRALDLKKVLEEKV